MVLAYLLLDLVFVSITLILDLVFVFIFFLLYIYISRLWNVLKSYWGSVNMISVFYFLIVMCAEYYISGV